MNSHYRALRELSATVPLLQGADAYQVCIPQHTVGDYGSDLCRWTPAWVHNYHRRFLPGTVSVVPGSGHEVLLERLVREWMLGLFYPNALRGLSIPEALVVRQQLPNWVLLAGALDTALALGAYPKLLHSADLNGLDCAGVNYRQTPYDRDSLSFGRGPNGLGLFSRGMSASPRHSCGLLAILPRA